MTASVHAKQVAQQVTGPVFALGSVSECGLRPCFAINLKSRPRYVRVKRLKSGVEAYFWSIPTWAKAQGCALPPTPLGCDKLAAYVQAEIQNLRFDRWRTGRRKALAVAIPTKTRRRLDSKMVLLKRFADLAGLHLDC